MANNSFGDFMPDVDFTSYMLESDPKMAYCTAAPFQGSSSPAQKRDWAGQFGNVYNQYSGAVGAALKEGKEAPSFVDYLKQTPFTERYSSLSPSMRPGGGFRRFSPGTRYMYS